MKFIRKTQTYDEDIKNVVDVLKSLIECSVQVYFSYVFLFKNFLFKYT